MRAGEEGKAGPDERPASTEEENRAAVEPGGDAAGKAVGAVSERAGDTVRDAVVEGEHEATPFIAFGGISLVLGVVVSLVIVVALIVYFAFGGR